MIAEQDRSGYFGASDTGYILGNTQTKTFRKWWLEKMGIPSKRISTRAMSAGTHFEHSILDYMGILSQDRQIILEDLKLRVNLDGDKDECIYEVKTCSADKPFKMPKKYIQQVQVQMFAFGWKRAKIVVYALTKIDYKNFFNKIDGDRLQVFDLEYDEAFINKEYLPQLKYFADCLTKGMIPDNDIEGVILGDNVRKDN